MAIPYKKYLKRLKKKSRRKHVAQINEKYPGISVRIDPTEDEKKFNEILISGEVPTKRRPDGTIVLREITDDEGNKVADGSVDQLISVDMFTQNYDESEVDNIIENNLQELLPDEMTTEDKVKKFFIDYELLKEEIDGAGGDESHQHLVDTSERYVPKIDPIIPLPTPKSILGNGMFEDGEMPDLVSKALNHEVIDDPTEIRPSAKILRFFGSKPGHLFMHKKNDDVKLKRGGLYECNYLIYVSDDYDGTHGVEFTKWENLDPELTVMTPIGSLPFDNDKQIIKGKWVRRNFWVKLPHRGEPTDFSWKLAYPMGKRPKGVDPGEAIGSAIYKIKLHKQYGKPLPEDFHKHKRLGQLWREMEGGNVGAAGGGTFVGISEFFKKLSEEMNDREYRAKLMGTEIRQEMRPIEIKQPDGSVKLGAPTLQDVPEGKQEVGKTVHPLSLHDKDKWFELWFAIKDVSKKHHTKILEDIMDRFDKFTWHPTKTDQDLFNEPREMFQPNITSNEMPPNIQVVSQAAPPPNINIKQPEIGMKMDGVNIKQDGTQVDLPTTVGSSTGVSTAVDNTDNSTQGRSDDEIKGLISGELVRLGLTGGAPAPAPAKKASTPKKKDFGDKLKDFGKKIFRRPRVRLGRRRRRRRRRWSDIRLKTNIRYVTTLPNGVNVYDYNYIWSNKKHRGVMAQQLIEKYPEAVKKTFGFYSVDYDKLWINFEDLNYG